MEKTFVDTNIFVYTLFDVDKEKQGKCINLFKKAETIKVKLWTTEWVVAELIWFLQRQKMSPDKIKKVIIKIMATNGLDVENKELIFEALDIWNETVNFIDAINSVQARKKSISSIYSYDKGLDQIKEYKRIEP